MRVVGGLECFSGGGRRIVLIIQSGGEMRESILRERTNPFRDHDGRSRVDFGTDGHVGGALAPRLNKRVLTRVSNEQRRSGGEIRLYAPMNELFVSKEREPQTEHIESDSPRRQTPIGVVYYGAASSTRHAHLLARRRLEVEEEDVQAESKPVHLALV